tara:strand:+ start:104 stop:442 length:339 start_codon:yes stop_codon:yes gene_type:complete
MMLIGVFAAATTLAVVSTQIDGIGATNEPTISKTALVEPETNISKIETAPAAKSVVQKITNSDPGVGEILGGMKKNASVEKADVENVTDKDQNRRSATQFAKDDENSTDWIK